jgi:hypothetical protein
MFAFVLLGTLSAGARAATPDGVPAGCSVAGAPHMAGYALPERARFDAWVPAHAAAFADFEALLRSGGVYDVVEPWTLWYQGTGWENGAYPPFVEPPREVWPAIVPTLRLLRDHVIPATGRLCVVSAYRTRAYNDSHGGKPGSKHLGFHGVDVIPVEPWKADALRKVLRRVHRRVGRPNRMGLGIYTGVRFHVDAWRFRSWEWPASVRRAQR